MGARIFLKRKAIFVQKNTLKCFFGWKNEPPAKTRCVKWQVFFFFNRLDKLFFTNKKQVFNDWGKNEKKRGKEVQRKKERLKPTASCRSTEAGLCNTAQEIQEMVLFPF